MSRVDRQDFLKLLAKQLYPVLRREGFKGSGTTLRRINGDVIHVFNVQGSMSGAHCYLNVGAHLSFLPPDGGGRVIAASLQEPACVFRDRIDQPGGPSSGWAYGDSVEAAERCVERIIQAWATQGHAFFERYATYPDSFLQLLQNTEPTGTNALATLHLARIAAHLGQRERAVAFARAGLAAARERATSLRQDLRAVLADVGAAPSETDIP